MADACFDGAASGCEAQASHSLPEKRASEWMNVESVATLNEDPHVKGVGHDRIGRIRTQKSRG